MQLTKHHGAGNDFLVVMVRDGDVAVDAARARGLCDRHTGIGADGLIVATSGGGDDADVTMVLFNADGGRAEMSGNGIRCLVQAALTAGLATGARVRVATDAGLKVVDVVDRPDPATLVARVAMGPVRERALPVSTGPEPLKAIGVDTGNPHVVRLLADPAALDADVAGFADPERNVEHVCAGPGPDAITMRVVERGVGETQACGTGACAAAWAARAWGLAGDRITVHQRGGDVVVDLVGDEAWLTGPAVFVATVEVADA